MKSTIMSTKSHLATGRAFKLFANSIALAGLWNALFIAISIVPSGGEGWQFGFLLVISSILAFATAEFLYRTIQKRGEPE